MTNNLAQDFLNNVQKHPDKIAFVIPQDFESLETYNELIITYQEFYNMVSRYRNGLIAEGYKKGDRLIILSPINENTYALMLAIFSLGMVTVFLDPGVGLKKILTTISDSKAKAIISIDKLLKWHFLIPQLWNKKKYSSDKKRIGVKKLESLYSDKVSEIIPMELKDTDHLLITYTSGSTGRSKGTDRNVKNVVEQIKFIKNNWVCTEDTIDFPSFPMFGFMNLLCGMTTVVPALDFAKISDFDPEVIIHQMKKWKVTRMCGSFTFNNELAGKIIENNEEIKTVKNIVFGGCPVTKEFCEKLKMAYPNAKSEIIYGSTEVAPISTVEVNELLNSEGMGFLVGKPYSGLDLSIVDLPGEIHQFDQSEDSPYKQEPYSIGEVIIKGPHVVQTYIENPKATRENKILNPDGQRWHRTGDSGYIDDQNRLWLVGRQNDILHFGTKQIHPYAIEVLIDALEGVKRSALIQNDKKTVLFYEANTTIDKQIEDKIISILESNHEELKSVTILITDKIPLDDRHNSKIDRVRLRSSI